MDLERLPALLILVLDQEIWTVLMAVQYLCCGYWFQIWSNDVNSVLQFDYHLHPFRDILSKALY